MIMDIEEIIKDAISVGAIRTTQLVFSGENSYVLSESQLLKLIELTLKRAPLSANEQDAERYRYLKENYVMANFNIYDDEDFSNGQTGLIIEVPNGIDINRDLDLVVDQALATYDKLSEVKS